MTNAENPLAVAGHNEPPDTGRMVSDQLAESYSKIFGSVTLLLSEARELPGTVDDDITMGNLSSMVKRMDDTAKIIETFRVKEKEPYLRGGSAVDACFNAIKDSLAKASAVLHARVHDYNQRKLAEERRRREEAAREAARVAQQARLEQERRDREAREAEEAARRARKPENVAIREEAANQATASAGVAKVQTYLAEADEQAAAVAVAKKPADMVRTRHDTGVMTTMAQKPHVAIDDRDKLDKDLLWPFLKEDAILSALKMWAKTKNHKTPMDGATIKMVDATVIK